MITNCLTEIFKLHAMLPYPTMPYGYAPAWCFPVFECGMYLLFIFCLAHAFRTWKGGISYLVGGLAFGLILEYVEVLSDSYKYGRFLFMLGNAPYDIPFCIGIGWGIIMYTARLFSDSIGLSLWACAALDTLLALNIDLSMDTVAYRLHMWHWDWSGTRLDPLKAQWFGIPYGNFIGWQTVVFCYSLFSRLFEKLLLRDEKKAVYRYILVAFFALVCSQIVLFATQTWVFPVLSKVGILSVHRFTGILLALIIMVVYGWRKRLPATFAVPVIAYWVPGWFHLFFGACFFIFGFYRENKWMTVAAIANLILGVVLHVWPVWRRRSKARITKF